MTKLTDAQRESLLNSVRIAESGLGHTVGLCIRVIDEQAAEIERLRAELAELADQMTQKHVAVYEWDKDRQLLAAANTEIERLRADLRDADECGAKLAADVVSSKAGERMLERRLAAVNAEIERLRATRPQTSALRAGPERQT